MTEDEAYAAVRDAIAAYFAVGQDGAVMEAFVLMAVGRTIDDALLDPGEGAKTRHTWAVNEGQQVYASVGLAHQLVEAVQQPDEDD